MQDQLIPHLNEIKVVYKFTIDEELAYARLSSTRGRGHTTGIRRNHIMAKRMLITASKQLKI